jgi:glycine oxidase
MGMLYVAFTKPEEDELKKRFLWQKKIGIDVVWKSRGAVLKSEKLVSPQARAGLFYPTVARVRAKPFMKAFKKYALHLGVSFRDFDRGPELLVHSGKVAGVQAGPEKFETAVAVNATGAWSGINTFLPYSPPVRPARGQIVIAQAPHSLKISTILHSLDGGYLVPWGGGRYLLGATLEFVGFKPYNTEKGMAQIRFKIQKLVPGFNSYKILESWAGLRPCAEDYLPLIGPCKIRGLYAANGYYRSGILIGHYAGELLAQSIISGKFPNVLEPFSPNRFASGK